jgi:hypothetical protein
VVAVQKILYAVDNNPLTVEAVHGLVGNSQGKFNETGSANISMEVDEPSAGTHSAKTRAVFSGSSMKNDMLQTSATVSAVVV